MDTAIRRTLVADKMCGLLGIPKKRGFAMVWPEAIDQEQLDIRSHIETSLSVATFQRSFCVTEHGYMGLVPRTARVGDVVCLLEGAQTPFILRANDSSESSGEDLSWNLIGEAYIHGVMDGEAWPPPEIRAFLIT